MANPSPQATSSTARVSLSPGAIGLLLPVALLAPGFLAWSPYPRIDGTGLTFLATLPVALLVLWRRRAGLPHQLLLPLGLWLLILGPALLMDSATDSLGRLRGMVLLTTGLLAFLGGASLERGERATLAAGLLCLGLLFGLPALLLGALGSDLAWAGVLGNPGALSQVLVPAGAAAVALLTRVQAGKTRLFCAAALATAALHAFLAPVHAGLISLLVASLAVTLFSRLRASLRVAPFAIAVILGLLLMGARSRDGGAPTIDTAPQTSAAQAGAAQDTVDLDGQSSGLSVRMAIARGSLKLWSAAGTGVGQYQAAFPPFREVEETERSRDGICQGGVREVEHPHNDWLLGLVELGLLGGLAWIALLLFGAYRAGLALLRGTSQDAAIGAGLIAVLANAFAHGPLLISPASSVLGFLLLGAAITTRPQAQRDPTLIAALGPASLVIACIAALQAPNAWALWQHGRSLGSASAALGDIQNAEAEIPRDELEPLLLQLEQSLDAALESVSGSALALRMTARFSPAVLGNTELRAPLWEALLMQQPNSFEALYELGLEQTRLINDSAARAAWEQALALQPTHPVLLRNIARLAFHGGDEETGDALLTQVQFQGCLEAGWIARLGEELCLLGRIPAGRSLLTREEPRLVDAGWYDALSQEARQGDLQRRSDALALVANLLWAREHAEAARWSDAVRLYRQALNRSRRYVEGGGACLRLEFAAAALIAGQDDVASAQLNGLTPTPLDLRDLPQWALDQLKENGVINATND